MDLAKDPDAEDPIPAESSALSTTLISNLDETLEHDSGNGKRTSELGDFFANSFQFD